MDDSQKYRRREDESTKLLIVLGERVANIQETLNEKLVIHESRLSIIEKNQNAKPCDTHELRLRYLERIIWGLGGAVILLIVEMVVSLFKATS